VSTWASSHLHLRRLHHQLVGQRLLLQRVQLVEQILGAAALCEKRRQRVLQRLLLRVEHRLGCAVVRLLAAQLPRHGLERR